MTPGAHFIVAEVDGASENEPPDFLDPGVHKNNFAAPPTPFDYEYQFGTVGGRSNVDLGTTSGSFNTTTLKFGARSADFPLRGGGRATINVVKGPGENPAVDIFVFTGTSAGSFALAAVLKGTN